MPEEHTPDPASGDESIIPNASDGDDSDGVDKLNTSKRIQTRQKAFDNAVYVTLLFFSSY